MTRDSVLWKVLFYGGLLLAVALEVFNALTPDMAAQLGLSPQVMAWLRIAYAIVIGVGGKLGLSWLPKKNDTDTPINPGRFATILLLGALLTFGGLSVGCAAKTPLAKAQVGALSAGKAALGIDQAEYDAYAAGAYDAKTHTTTLGVPIRSLLYTVRGYERAVAAWSGDPYAQPAAVAQARAAVAASIGDLERALAPVKGADKILAAIRACKLAMGFPLTPADEWPPPTQAGLPILALLGLIWKVYQERDQQGTAGHFLLEMFAALKKAGVSQEELAAVDAELTAAIERREHEAPPTADAT